MAFRSVALRFVALRCVPKRCVVLFMKAATAYRQQAGVHFELEGRGNASHTAGERYGCSSPTVSGLKGALRGYEERI